MKTKGMGIFTYLVWKPFRKDGPGPMPRHSHPPPPPSNTRSTGKLFIVDVIKCRHLHFLVKRLGILEHCLDYMSLQHVVRAVCQWSKWAVPVMMRSLIHCQRFFCHSLFVIHFLLQVNTLSQKSSRGQCDRDVPSLCGALYLDSLTILLFFFVCHC